MLAMEMDVFPEDVQAMIRNGEIDGYKNVNGRKPYVVMVYDHTYRFIKTKFGIYDTDYEKMFRVDDSAQIREMMAAFLKATKMESYRDIHIMLGLMAITDGDCHHLYDSSGNYERIVGVAE